jgi:UPF0716 protein FxsA
MERQDGESVLRGEIGAHPAPAHQPEATGVDPPAEQLMRILFLLIFLAVPLAEIALLIQLSHWIGTLQTIGLVILTAFVGTYLLRQQGLRTLMKVSGEVQSGKAPVVPVVEGVLLLISGAFLLTPGVITDAIGAALLVPPVREAVARYAVRTALDKGFVHVATSGSMGDRGTRSGPEAGHGDPRSRWDRPRAASDDIIEGDYERVDEKTMRPGSGTNRRDD